jgi:hypothetical protein
MAIPSAPPTVLFRFMPGGSFQSPGSVTLDGAQTDLDALAQLPSGALRAFALGGGGSRLVEIIVSPATAVERGPLLKGRDLRGAVALSESELPAVDAAAGELLRIDAASGEIIGVPLPLLAGCVPLSPPDLCDLALAADGTVLLVAAGEIRSLDVETGGTRRVYLDQVPISGVMPAYCGAAFATDADLACYEISGPDDIVSFDTAIGFVRTNLFLNIIPALNSGRGNLARWVDAIPVALPPPGLADLNADDAVDAVDLAILLGSWGPVKP